MKTLQKRFRNQTKIAASLHAFRIESLYALIAQFAFGLSIASKFAHKLQCIHWIYWKICGCYLITFAQRGGTTHQGAFFVANYLNLKLEGGGGQKFRKYANVIFVRSLIANDDYSTFMLSPWYFNPLYRTIQAQSVTNWV